LFADNSEPIHAPGTLEETLPPEKCLGPVDLSTIEKVVDDKDNHGVVNKEIPPLHQVVNIDDFEVASPAIKLNVEICATSRKQSSMGLLFFCSR
jgi:hypothetical protein